LTSGSNTYIAEKAYRYNGEAWVALDYTDETTV
jgi:hypothetical protein